MNMENEGIKYCRTGKFRDMKFSRIWAIGNSSAGNFRQFLISRAPILYAGNISVQEIFANLREFVKFAKISCMRKFAVLQ